MIPDVRQHAQEELDKQNSLLVEVAMSGICQKAYNISALFCLADVKRWQGKTKVKQSYILTKPLDIFLQKH